MEILVSYDKLTVIAGEIDVMFMEEFLSEPGYILQPVGLKGQTVLNRLTRPGSTIDLSLPGVMALLDMIVAAGGLSAGAKQRILDFVAAQQAAPAEPQPPKANYRVPVANAVGNPWQWITNFVENDPGMQMWQEGNWLMVATSSTCNAPGAEVLP